MIVNRLGMGELAYELKIRGIGTETCEKMRHRLVLALHMERSGDSLHYLEYPFLFAKDETAVMKKLEEISGLVDSFSGPRTSSEAEKLQTKMAHVLGRIDRMDPGGEADKQEKKTGLVASAFSLLGRFHHKCDDGGSSPPSRSRVAPLEVDVR
ncbi:hypothetical protein JTB14_031501 [Gonioctena quinquepunctata]|nr:hypothetical protein JTB14_031501 [Gonioctena quinquepunctata]